MNNLMHDIKEGFIQRRLPDGGFKVIILWFSFDCLDLKAGRLRSIYEDNSLLYDIVRCG